MSSPATWETEGWERKKEKETWRIYIPQGAGVPLPSCQNTKEKNPPTELVGDEKNSQRTLNSWIVFLCGKKSRKFSPLFSIAAAAPFSLPPRPLTHAALVLFSSLVPTQPRNGQLCLKKFASRFGVHLPKVIQPQSENRYTSGDSSKRWRNESALPQLFFSSVVIRQIKGDNLQRGLGVVMCANPDGRSFYL